MYAVDRSAGVFPAPAAEGAVAGSVPVEEAGGGAAFAEHVAEALRAAGEVGPEHAAEPLPADDGGEATADAAALAVLMMLATAAQQTPQAESAPADVAEADHLVAPVSDAGTSSGPLASTAAGDATPAMRVVPTEAPAVATVRAEPVEPPVTTEAEPAAAPSGELNGAPAPAGSMKRTEAADAPHEPPAGAREGREHTAPLPDGAAEVQVKTVVPPAAAGTAPVPTTPPQKGGTEVAVAAVPHVEAPSGQAGAATVHAPAGVVDPQAPAPAATDGVHVERGTEQQEPVTSASPASTSAARAAAFHTNGAAHHPDDAGDAPGASEPASPGSINVGTEEGPRPAVPAQGATPPPDARPTDAAPAGPTTVPASLPAGDAPGLSDTMPAPAARVGSFAAALASLDMDSANVQTVVRTMRLQTLTDGASEARLRLEPEHLGPVALTVRVEQGSVSAHFRAETPDAQRWIETHQQELRTALREQGLEVKELVVTTDPDGRQHQERQQDQPSRQRPRSRRPEPAAWDAPRFEVVV